MSNYKISIIIPVYNVEQYLDDAMNSLLNQTIGFENLQVIFADDCSTDNSGKIIDDYAKKYSNVTVVHLPENSGAAGKPQNEAMKLADAPYLMILGSDDYFTDIACQTLYNKVEETGAEIVGGDHKAIDEDDNVLYEKWPEIKDIQRYTFRLPEDLTDAVRYRGSIVTKIYKMEFLKRNEIDFPEHIPGQDLVFLCKCFSKANHVEYFSEPIYVYRIRSKKDPSISFIKTEKYFNGINECYRLCYGIFEKIRRLDVFGILIYSIMDYYIEQMIDSEEISQNQIAHILENWQWIFSFTSNNQVKYLCVYTDIIMSVVLSGNFTEAARILSALKSIKRNFNESRDANTWLKSQLENYKKDNQNSNQVITELRNWVTEVEEGKKYLEDQLNIAKKEKEEIAAHCLELEGQFDDLNNIISKQKYKLNVLINDVGVQKIIKKKKYDV